MSEEIQITLTSDLIHHGATAHDGFKKAQLAVLGVAWPPKKGWLSGLIGTKVSMVTYNRFIALGNPGPKHSARAIKKGQELYEKASAAEIVTGAWSGTTWDDLPDHVKEACIRSA